MLRNLVNGFRDVGVEALRLQKKGRNKVLDMVNKCIKVQSENEPSTDVNTEYIKQLKDELLKLSIENAFKKT